MVYDLTESFHKLVFLRKICPPKNNITKKKVQQNISYRELEIIGCSWNELKSYTFRAGLGDHHEEECVRKRVHVSKCFFEIIVIQLNCIKVI